MYVAISSVIIYLKIILTYSYLENARFTKIKHIILENNRRKDNKI